MNKFIISLISIVVIALLVALGYFIFQNQKLIAQLSTTSPSPQAASPLPSPSPASPSPSPTTSLETLKENIETAINSKNTAALTTFMTNPVQVVLQATECCGPMTPAEAESQISYIAEGIPFDFNQNSDTAKNLKAKNPELAGKFIGISQSKGHLVAFGLDSQSKIADLRMSVSWKLFNN